MDTNKDDDFAASIGAVPAEDDFATSIGAVPVPTTVPTPPPASSNMLSMSGSSLGNAAKNTTLEDVGSGVGNFLESAVASGQNMLPGIGLIDKAAAGTNATLQEVGDLFRDPQNQEDWKDRYNKAVKDAAQDRQNTMDKSTAGKVVGTAAGMVPNIALGGAIAKPLSLGGSILAGAAMDGANEGFKSTDKFFDTDKAVDTAKTSAMWGGGLGLGLKGAEKTAPWIGKKLAKLLSIGDGERVDRYAANPAKYNQRQVDVESVVEELSPEMRKIERFLETSKNKASTAKEVADEAKKLYTQGLRDTTPRASAQTALRDALESQQGKVSDLAKQQREIVSASDVKIPTDTLKRITDADLAERSINGVAPKGDSRIAGIKQLQALIDTGRKGGPSNKPGIDPLTLNFKPADTSFTPKDLVNTRQSVDDQIKTVYNAVGGKMTAPAESTGLALRKEINNLLDANASDLPGYIANRGALAKESGVLSRASKELGDPDTAKVLSDIDPRGGANFSALKELDANNGKKVLPNLAEYLAAKGKLRDPTRLNKNLENLSQSKAATKATKEAALRERLFEKQYGDLSSDKGKMEAAVRKALFANANKPAVKTMESLGNLGKKSGVDVAELIDQLQVQSAFRKTGPAGSRLVNIGENVVDNVPLVPKGTGSLLGGMLDVTRGYAAKKAVDAGHAIGKSNAGKKAASQITPSINEIIRQLLEEK